MRKRSLWCIRCLVAGAIGLLLGALVSCLPLGPPNPVRVVYQGEALNFEGKRCVIPDFYVPEHGAGLGGGLADLLQTLLIERELFAEVSRNLPVVWTRPGETMETRYRALAQAATQQKFDYLMVGLVDSLFYGGLGDTQMSLTLRLIDVSSGQAVYIASHQGVSEPKDPSYPLDTKLTRPAESPLKLAEKLLNQVVARLK